MQHNKQQLIAYFPPGKDDIIQNRKAVGVMWLQQIKNK